MADNITPDISKSLYLYMCQDIVGSEEHVKRMRLMNAARDRVASNKYVTYITSGSFGEGLEMRGSDFDLMNVLTLFEVFEKEKPCFYPNITYFSMEIDDVKPCYTQLILEHVDYSIGSVVFSQCEDHQNGKHYYSSILVKKWFKHFATDIIHGPCITDKYGLCDEAVCLHCKTWVSAAEQWITRPNNSWPSHDIKQSIIKHGVLFVPVGVKGSPKEDLEWRVSFSVGEKLLINTFSHTQLLCYALLKIILKDVIATYPGCKDLLCSYFLKTIVFWISEELPQSVWKPNNLVPCFMRCLTRLIYCVEHAVCLHFFIPENNLFENKIEGRAREILLDKLNTLHSYGWRCILFSDQISNFPVEMRNFHMLPEVLHVKDVEKILKSNLLHCRNNVLGKEEPIVYNNIIQSIVSCKQSSIKHLFKYFMSMVCQGRVQYMPMNSNNKYQYKQYKSCLSFLLQGVYHDAVSGWLMVASLFYKTKQYFKAVHVIMSSLSNCTTEKLHLYMNMADIHYQLLKQQTFQKKNVVSLMKTMFVDFIKFSMTSTLIPDEVQIHHSDRDHVYSCTAYAYFLTFLCYYHLNNVRKCQDSLQGLQLVIIEDFLMTNVTKAEAFSLLGIALQLFGDPEYARKAFLVSDVNYTLGHELYLEYLEQWKS